MELDMFQLHDLHHTPVTYYDTTYISMIFSLVLRLKKKEVLKQDNYETIISSLFTLTRTNDQHIWEETTYFAIV